MRQPVDLVGGFYADDTLPWSCQDTVNYLPVQTEAAGTRTMTKLVDAPGLRPWLWIGHTQSGTVSGPVRGLHDVEGQLFAVCGRTLYQISNKKVAIPIGTIPGVGRVSMAHNQRSTGNELIIVNGSGGYVWNTATQDFKVVTDEGYPGASVVDFIDGYLMQVEPFGRFLFHSNLADALDYSTLDRFEAETSPDRTLGMIVNHQEVWAFGERSIDVFGNAGTAQGTFQNKGVSISRGCAAKWSPAVIDNGVAWLGDDLKVYHTAGYSPTRISTRAIEVALSECSRTDLRNAFSFVWEDLSHAVYYLTVPNGPTFGYDFSTGLWHRRSSWHPEHDLSRRWRVNDLVKHNGEWISADYQTGKLYVLDWDYMLEGCEPLVRERVSPVAHNDGRGFVIDSSEVFFDTGGAETECVEWPVQPVGPTISGDAPDGAIGIAYAGFAYTLTPGDAPIAGVSLISGSLPPGLSIDTGGVIDSGTPSAMDSYTFTLRVTDTSGLSSDHDDTIRVTAVSFATRVGMGGHLIVSATGETWGGDIDTGHAGDIDLLKCAGGNVYAFDGAIGRVSMDYGQTWHNVAFNGDVSDVIRAIGYSNGVWVALMRSGEVCWRSTDGISFVPVAISDGVRSWYSVAGRGQDFLASSTTGRIYRSSDSGLTWSYYTAPGGSVVSYGVVYAHRDAFIACGGSASTVYTISSRDGGSTWSINTPNWNPIGGAAITSRGEELLAANGINFYTSVDLASSWEIASTVGSSPTGQENNIANNGVYYITCYGGGQIAISTNGQSWTLAHSAGGSAPYKVASLGDVTG